MVRVSVARRWVGYDPDEYDPPVPARSKISPEFAGYAIASIIFAASLAVLWPTFQAEPRRGELRTVAGVLSAPVHLSSPGCQDFFDTSATLNIQENGIPYSASKAGVISLVQTTANFLRGTGVRVNAICPGLIETGMTKSIFEMARARGSEDRLGQLCALARHGRPEEIAAMASFLASDEGSYVNGQAMIVDGGSSSSHPFTLPRR